MDKQQKTILLSAAGVLITCLLLYLSLSRSQEMRYYQHQGNVFGTYYNIRYEATESYEDSILLRLKEFDASLSTFNQASTIAVLNQGRDTVLDAFFLQMFATAQEVSRISNGAFDITVAPLVNAWGFGFKNKENVTPEMIDSIRLYVGYQSVSVEGQHLVKQSPQTMLDASAIAKGYGCDVVADFLREKGCRNLLVDIGGECVLEGLNQEGHPWRVGITKPIDDTSGQTNDIQQVIASEHLCMATSGNYRQFYYEGGLRRSHTIDPRTGYPAGHNLLSATITASSCMRADALATACMVLGADSAMALINNIPDAECYLICSTEADTMTIQTSPGFPL